MSKIDENIVEDNSKKRLLELNEKGDAATRKIKLIELFLEDIGLKPHNKSLRLNESHVYGWLVDARELTYLRINSSAFNSYVEKIQIVKKLEDLENPELYKTIQARTKSNKYNL